MTKAQIIMSSIYHLVSKHIKYTKHKKTIDTTTHFFCSLSNKVITISHKKYQTQQYYNSYIRHLQYWHFILELGLLFCRKSQFINHLYCHLTIVLSSPTYNRSIIQQPMNQSISMDRRISTIPILFIKEAKANTRKSLF